MERTRKGLADEQSLTGHRDALPIGLEQGVAPQVMIEQHLRVRKFLDVVAGLRYRSIGARRPLPKPGEHPHLIGAVEKAADRRQMIGHRARPKMQSPQLLDESDAGEIPDDVGHVALYRG